MCAVRGPGCELPRRGGQHGPARPCTALTGLRLSPNTAEGAGRAGRGAAESRPPTARHPSPGSAALALRESQFASVASVVRRAVCRLCELSGADLSPDGRTDGRLAAWLPPRARAAAAPCQRRSCCRTRPIRQALRRGAAARQPMRWRGGGGGGGSCRVSAARLRPSPDELVTGRGRGRAPSRTPCRPLPSPSCLRCCSCCCCCSQVGPHADLPGSEKHPALPDMPLF